MPDQIQTREDQAMNRTRDYLAIEPTTHFVIHMYREFDEGWTNTDRDSFGTTDEVIAEAVARVMRETGHPVPTIKHQHHPDHFEHGQQWDVSATGPEGQKCVVIVSLPDESWS